jgi:hypothetical protein
VDVAEDRAGRRDRWERLRPAGALGASFTAREPAPAGDALPVGRDAPPTRVTSPSAASPTSPIVAAVGMGGDEVYEMFRLLGVAEYDERYVIPAVSRHPVEELATTFADFASTRASNSSYEDSRRGMSRGTNHSAQEVTRETEREQKAQLQ